MRVKHPAIDYAEAVLSKYPEAKAVLLFGGEWRIYSDHYNLSGLHSDRDAAWEDAYRRMLKKGKS